MIPGEDETGRRRTVGKDRVDMDNLLTVWQHLLCIQVSSDLDEKFLTNSMEMTKLVHL